MKVPNTQIDKYIANIADTKIAGCLLYGPEKSLIEYRSKIIARKIVSNLSDPFLVANLSKEQIATNQSLVIDEFYSISMMGGRKLIIVNNPDVQLTNTLKSLVAYLDSGKTSENFLLIAAGDLAKTSPLRKIAEQTSHLATISCYEDGEAVIKSFIEQKLREREIIFDHKLVVFLQQKLGMNRNIIINEIDKIDIFSGKDRKIEAEVIDQLICDNHEATGQDFVMNFASGNYSKALNLAEKNFINGTEPITLIRFLNNYLQKIYQAQIDINIKKLSHEVAVKNQWLFFKMEIEFKKHLLVLEVRKVIELLSQIEKLELDIKRAVAPARLLFKNFILSQL